MVVCFTETVSHTIPITALTTVLLFVLFHRQFLSITVESQDPAFIICVEGPGTKTRVRGCPMGDGDGGSGPFANFFPQKMFLSNYATKLGAPPPPPPHTHTLISFFPFLYLSGVIVVDTKLLQIRYKDRQPLEMGARIFVWSAVYAIGHFSRARRCYGLAYYQVVKQSGVQQRAQHYDGDHQEADDQVEI